MQRQITPDQCYCSFGDGIVYEFVPHNGVHILNDCVLCSLWAYTAESKEHLKCISVPCQKGLRKDKNGGFWRISENVDYQTFEKMLKNGG